MKVMKQIAISYQQIACSDGIHIQQIYVIYFMARFSK